tara:strand:- start:442 stop:1422 length:981 start_codon:yes stop_codon:yes gene_type:complete
MKKFFTLLSLLAVMGMNANVMAQTFDQITTINSTRPYYVNSNDGATELAGHTGSTYVWTVYDYQADFLTATNLSAAESGDFSFVGGASTTFKTEITWLTAGNYVVEVVEESTDNCTTIRRFSVQILELDLLVETYSHDDLLLNTDLTTCNTNSGNIWGTTHDDDLNQESLETMTFEYKVLLYTKKAGAATDEIATVYTDAKWKFTVNNTANTKPTTSQADITWNIPTQTGVTGTLDENGEGTITASGVSEVTIEVTIQNVADAAAKNYVLDFDIAPSTVLVDLNADDVFSEGIEPDNFDGTNDSHTNSAYQITVNPIPNTTNIKSN